MAAVQRLAWRFRPAPPLMFALANGVATPSACSSSTSTAESASSSKQCRPFNSTASSSSSSSSSKAGWFSGLTLPKVVKAGDPVLHQPAREVDPSEMKSEKVQKIIDDMIRVMRNAPGVGLAAPQIGLPFRIIVLEDKKEYMGYDTKGEIKPQEIKAQVEAEIKAQDRRPFDLLVILNPKLEKKSNRTALFFEGCLRLLIDTLGPFLSIGLEFHEIMVMPLFF